MRSVGVLLVAIFLILEGFASILTTLGMIFAREEVYDLMKGEFERILENLNATHLTSQTFDILYEITCFATLFFGVLYLIVAAGVLALRNWARISAIVLLVLQFVYSLAMVYIDPFSILGVAIAAVLVWYLLRKEVKEKFSGKSMSIEERVLGKKI